MIPFCFFSCKQILKYGDPNVSTSRTPTLPMEKEIWRTQSNLDELETRKRSRPIALPIALFTCGTTFRSMRICIAGNPLEPQRRTSTLRQNLCGLQLIQNTWAPHVSDLSTLSRELLRVLTEVHTFPCQQRNSTKLPQGVLKSHEARHGLGECT